MGFHGLLQEQPYLFYLLVIVVGGDDVDDEEISVECFVV
jgi:hypothetical protein